MLDALLLAAALVCQTADTATTVVAINRGYTESNPLIGTSRARVIGIKVGLNVSMLIWRAKTDNTAVKRAIPLALAGAGCTAGVLNWRTLRRDP